MAPVHLCDRCNSPKAQKLPSCPACGHRHQDQPRPTLRLSRGFLSTKAVPPPPPLQGVKEGPPPAAPLHSPEPPHKATGGRVLLAHLTDASLLVGAGFLVFTLQSPGGGAPEAPFSGSLLNVFVESILPFKAALHTSWLVTLLGGVLYGVFSGLKSNLGLGRRLTGIRLVKLNGEPPSTTRLLLRGLLAPISALLFGAGFFWALVDPAHRTWHDVFCGTRFSS